MHLLVSEVTMHAYKLNTYIRLFCISSFKMQYHTLGLLLIFAQGHVSVHTDVYTITIHAPMSSWQLVYRRGQPARRQLFQPQWWWLQFQMVRIQVMIMQGQNLHFMLCMHTL